MLSSFSPFSLLQINMIMSLTGTIGTEHYEKPHIPHSIKYSHLIRIVALRFMTSSYAVSLTLKLLLLIIQSDGVVLLLLFFYQTTAW